MSAVSTLSFSLIYLSEVQSR